MKVGIIGAMDIEVAYLKSRLEGAREHALLGMSFCEGTLEGVPAVVVQCGIGKVNAALCAQALVERFGVSAVVNTGVAGSLDARIDIGDLVVSTDAVHHDMDVQALGYVAGQVPGMDVLAFPASDALRGQAVSAAREAAPEARVFEGRIASGDQFVGSAEERDRIVLAFGALCCEMEGAAIAHACHLLQTPFVIVRVISDKADGSASMDYPSFKELAARRCAGIVERLVKAHGSGCHA